jgi:hypothetical protein
MEFAVLNAQAVEGIEQGNKDASGVAGSGGGGSCGVLCCIPFHPTHLTATFLPSHNKRQYLC